MARGAEQRSSVRMRLNQGVATLVHPAMPALKCVLLDIGEGGLRCQTSSDLEHDEFIISSWRAVLRSEKPFQIDLRMPIEGQALRMEGTVRHLKFALEEEIEFGVQFKGVDEHKRHVLGRLMKQFAKTGHGTMTGTISSSKGNFVDPERLAARPAAPLRAPTPAAGSATQSPSSKETQRRSVGDIARGLWGSITGGNPPASVSDAARKAVPAAVSLQDAAPPASYRGMKVGEILQRLGKLKAEKAMEAYEQARAANVKFGRYLLDKKLVTPVDLCRALSLQSGLPIVDLASVKLPDAVKNLFPPALLKQHQFVPFNRSGGQLYVAAVQPLAPATLQKLEALCGCGVKIFLAQDDVVSEHLKKLFITFDF